MADDKTTATAKTADPVAEAVARGVERWIDQNLRNTPFSQDTGAWNFLQGTLVNLAPTIVEELK